MGRQLREEIAAILKQYDVPAVFFNVGTNLGTVGADGKVLGHFCASGVRPRFADRLRQFGAPVAESAFDPDRTFE